MKKLLLVNPVGRHSGYLLSRYTRFPPLGLGYVAAATPPGWSIKIIDENFDAFAFEEADLVGLTAFTSSINRAYEIAEVYRSRGTPVVVGGIHASMYPQEAQQYADAVVVGEVETVWKDVIFDFESKKLAGQYHGLQTDLRDMSVVPRRDLFHPDYLWQSVQTSRGCPFNCNYCSVTRYMGNRYRKRRAVHVLDELASIDGRYVAFVDDNLIGYSEESRRESKALFEGMIERGLRKKWWMQTSINAADDEETIELASAAGCMFAFIGFETIDARVLSGMRKGVNLKAGVENYRKAVDLFHKYRIGVLGAFIIGNDMETPQYYKELADYFVRSGIDMFQISILTPLPGTRLMEDLAGQGRLIYDDFPQDWDKYRFSYMVHRPEGVAEDTVYTADNYLKRRLYSFPWYPMRLLRSLVSLRNGLHFMIAYKLNQALRRSWRNSHYYEKYPMRF